MKLSSFVAIAAVIGGSFLIPNPAEARNGWVYVTSDRNGAANYMRYLGRSGSIATILSKWSDIPEEQIIKYNCSTWMKQVERGPWKPIYPGSNADTKARKVC